ncbi:MAG: hypothetical protein Q8927_18835 [Bacteroidota bacterium]|nr:hypothetical protein [Bacteroidota bacterium]MDP4218262.1 hypothetical protein [Bacteroidota bacterium]MDP4260821.1 hypothetical protein [Bacteroidota bacterium]
METELRDGHAATVLKGKRQMCWVGYAVGETTGQYYLDLTTASVLTTKIITPIVDLWRTILDHFVITMEAQSIRVNIDEEDLDQIDLLRNLGFKPAPPTSEAPDYLGLQGGLSDLDPALVCTRQDYLDSRDRTYYENT